MAEIIDTTLHCGSIECYKLFPQRRDGSSGPLFINRHQVLAGRTRSVAS
jgi:hypothetical protein